jgi:hypothetical protein
MVQVHTDIEFTTKHGVKHPGFYMDNTLKLNIDNYLIKGVERKFDGVMLFTGIEGAGKTTQACTIAKYVDPTFPGPVIEGTNWRRTDRIVFTNQQIMNAIDTAKPGQAIVIDEAVLSMSSQDFNKEVQKILVKKFVTIRKKRLYIFVVIPSIFMLRRYFAIFRTRALLHATVKHGIDRGFFKFYSYDTKRQLFIKGIKEFNMNCVKPDFQGRFVDTEHYFFDPVEYDKKKEAAIIQLTEEPEKKKEKLSGIRQTIKDQRDELVFTLFNQECIKNPKYSYTHFVKHLNNKFRYFDNISDEFIGKIIRRMREDKE